MHRRLSVRDRVSALCIQRGIEQVGIAQLMGSRRSHHSEAPYLSAESSVASLPTSFLVFVSFSLYSTRCVAVGAFFFQPLPTAELMFVLWKPPPEAAKRKNAQFLVLRNRLAGSPVS